MNIASTSASTSSAASSLVTSAGLYSATSASDREGTSSVSTSPASPTISSSALLPPSSSRHAKTSPLSILNGVASSSMQPSSSQPHLLSTSSAASSPSSPSFSHPGLDVALATPQLNGKHSASNGTSTNGATNGSGRERSIALPLTRAIARVNPPGEMMYPDSSIPREEYVRLVLQSLKDIGYTQAASVLEAESGYSFETDLVSSFRESVLEGRWEAVESLLEHLGIQGHDDLRFCQFLIRQQKYLECLESRRSDAALQILRNDLAPISFDSDRLHLLSSLMMCTSIDDLKRRAEWSGTNGDSRTELLAELQRVIPPTLMLPPRRLEALLTQAQEAQRAACFYHNSNAPFSLYTDHACTRALFPGVTTNVLAEHDGEVWNVEWSPDGRYLASGGLDRCVIVWSIGPAAGSVGRTCQVERVFREHDAEISALAWSHDGSSILVCAGPTVKLWNVKSGVCSKEIKDHHQPVTAAKWAHDGTGFYTGALDNNIHFYDNTGIRIDSKSYLKFGLRVVDLSLTPDGRYLIAVGQPATSSSAYSRQSTTSLPTISTTPEDWFPLPIGQYSHNDDLRAKRTQMVVIDLKTGTKKMSQIKVGDMTSVRISPDSRFAVINYAPNVVFTWDIENYRLVRRYMGHQHKSQVLRSCFGGSDGTWIISGDEDRMIHVWHRDTGDALELLEGHKAGTVNAVAWNPVDDTVFASASDDSTIRIWESPTWESQHDMTFLSSPLIRNRGLYDMAEMNENEMDPYQHF